MLSSTATTSLLARRFASLALTKPKPQPSISAFFLSSSVSNHAPSLFATTRWMSGKKKSRDERMQGSMQHEEWVKFQQSIAVDGFDTGQITEAKTSFTKRGGKKAKKKEQREQLLRMQEQERYEPGGGQFPPMRYSDEETERLLAEAYANIPPRAGKRGTKNLRRQRLRWFRVRKIHAKEKKWRIRAHFRKMEKRSRIFREVKEVKADAEEVRSRDKEYQMSVLRDWYMITKEGKESVLGEGGGSFLEERR